MKMMKESKSYVTLHRVILPRGYSLVSIAGPPGNADYKLWLDLLG